MNYNEFAKEVHVNSCAHGWWETDRSLGEVIALCHSEISEALEEYRAGNRIRPGQPTPMLYYSGGGYVASDVTECCKKPEGIAVELADCMIRIFDYFGKMQWNAREMLDEAKGGERWMSGMPVYRVDSFGDFAARLHLDLSLAYKCWCNAAGHKAAGLRMAVCCNEILDWAEREGVDVDKILSIKHEYNKSRPYKHGGKVI